MTHFSKLKMHPIPDPSPIPAPSSRIVSNVAPRMSTWRWSEIGEPRCAEKEKRWTLWALSLSLVAPCRGHPVPRISPKLWEVRMTQVFGASCFLIPPRKKIYMIYTFYIYIYIKAQKTGAKKKKEARARPSSIFALFHLDVSRHEE